MIKITVRSARRSCFSYVSTRDNLHRPLDMELFISQVHQMAEALVWMCLGYPEADFLEGGSPWKQLEEQAEQEEEPSRERCPACNRFVCYSSGGGTFCPGCSRPLNWCDCEPLIPGQKGG